MAVAVISSCAAPSSPEEAEAAGWHELEKYCEGEGLKTDAFRLVGVVNHSAGWSVEFETKETPRSRVYFLFKPNGFVETSLRSR